MQRLYSIFPQGLPGLGLMLLRATVILLLVGNLGGSPCVWKCLWTAGLVLALSFGIATSAACVGVIAALLWSWIEHGTLPIATVSEGLVAASLILLGPGAYSLDARLFGRRTMDLPDP